MTVRTSPPGRPGSGFTLLELIVVLSLMGLVALLVLPSFTTGWRGLELETSARDLMTRMRQARGQAIATQQVHRIVLQADAQGGRLVSLLTDAYGGVIERVEFPPGITLEGTELPLRISFLPNGRSTGARFQLRLEKGRSLELQVDQITGLARVISEPRQGSGQG